MVAAGGSVPTATIAGDAERATRAYGTPLELLAPRRTIISVTRGENSIPTKNAVAIQIASLTSVPSVTAPP